jgi:ATP-dependent helicase HrpB
MLEQFQNLKIYSHHQELKEAIENYSSILIKSSPGSGKTTFIPCLVQEVTQGKILVLEPRRLAAKLASNWIEKKLEQKPSRFVGYQFRDENKTNENTKIHFVTEGTFLKIVLNNPTLEGISAVILDEFHERNWQTDIGISVLHSLQKRVPELKLIIMSATINEMPLQRFFNSQIKILNYELPPYPLKTIYASSELLKKTLPSQILQSVMNSSGDTLIFLPGLKEIYQVRDLLEENHIHPFILHSSVKKEDQELIFEKIESRKIILATNIAESSLTIDGIQTVIDSGLMRENQYSPWSGISELITKKCSQFSCVQRAGRANRTQEGTCMRLFSVDDFKQRKVENTAEIHNVDLAEIILFKQALPYSFEMFESPQEQKWETSLKLLKKIGALDENAKITPIGHFIIHSPLPPRYARVFYESLQTKNPSLITEVIEKIVELLNEGSRRENLIQKLKREQQNKETESTVAQTMVECFLQGFFDHLARYRREQDDFVTATGAILKLSKAIEDEFYHHPWWLILNVDPSGKYITKLIPVEKEMILKNLQNKIQVKEEYQGKSLSRQYYLDSLLIQEEKLITKESQKHSKHQSLKEELMRFRQSQEYQRILFFSHKLLKKDLSDFPWEILEEELLDYPENQIWDQIVLELKLHIDPQYQFSIDDYCPKEYILHDRKKVLIHYEENKNPWIESFIQDFYGRKNAPSIFKGEIPLTLSFLGPHKRSLQLTSDFFNFFTKTYFEIVGELRREYPKHYWPDKPLDAKPILFKKLVT